MLAACALLHAFEVCSYFTRVEEWSVCRQRAALLALIVAL